MAGDKHHNIRGCDLSGVFMPCMLIVFLLLMQTLSIITFSSDWKWQALLNRKTAKEWNVYPLHPHYKAFRNWLIRPNTLPLNYVIPTPFSDVVWTLCWSPGFSIRITYLGKDAITLPALQLYLLSQILCFQDVKQERTFDWDPSMMGQAERVGWDPDTVAALGHVLLHPLTAPCLYDAPPPPPLPWKQNDCSCGNLL